jgi:hypothetical protein
MEGVPRYVQIVSPRHHPGLAHALPALRLPVAQRLAGRMAAVGVAAGLGLWALAIADSPPAT